MSEVLQTVKGFLREDGIEFVEGEGFLTLPMADAAGMWTGFVRDLNGALIVSAMFPVNVPADRRGAVAELLTRLNWQLAIGNWEMNWDDGQVAFRTSLPLREMVLTPQGARDVCYCNFATFTRSWGMLLAVITGHSLPQEAIDAHGREIEQQRQQFEELMKKAGFDPDAEPHSPSDN